MPAKKAAEGFTEEERAAMRQRAREQRSRSRPGPEEREREVLDKIAAMAPPDRALAERVHAILRASAPTLTSRTWYGKPAYAKDGDVVCFFQDAGKFKTRYATLGFRDEAKLDEGHLWPVAYAETEIAAADEARIAALVKKAIG
jgi:uncharacterized protein YdhG (YjbR/CyaY superfamily)